MEEKRSTKIVTIPNILSLFRFVLAFLFAWVYLHATTPREYYIAAIIIVVSAITDVVDGKIARRFHMISELGKILDPVADKFTQGILALCLMKNYRLMIALVIVFLVKEAYMTIRGIIVLRESGRNDGAKWYGKLNTVVLYLVMFALLVYPEMPQNIANVLILFCVAVMFFSWFKYAKMYHQILKEARNGKEENTRKNGKGILGLMMIAVLCVSICQSAEAWEGDSVTVVALGDSIAKGYSGNQENIASYSQILADEIGWEDKLNVNYYNYAKNGLNSAGLNERVLIKKEVLASLQQADVITVTIGANDLLDECKKEAQDILNTETRFESANQALTALKEAVSSNPLVLFDVIKALGNWDYSTFEEQWKIAMETINAHKKDSAQVIVTNIYNPVANLEMPGTMNKVVESVIGNMNKVMTDHQKEYGYELVDVFESEVSFNTQADGLHPNQTGQEMIAALVTTKVVDPSIAIAKEKEQEQAAAKVAAEKKAAQKEAEKVKKKQMTMVKRLLTASMVGIVLIAAILLLRSRKAHVLGGHAGGGEITG
ncbi:MAG: GDSL-type esterase/lipase family protein [Hespellia sp.]|nr:GDSL-type esterase/lipase family protein [Hespellia sp.]